MKSARTPEDGRAGWKIVGFAWEQTSGQWERFLVRKSKYSGRFDVTRLLWVSNLLPVCWVCLSQLVMAVPTYADPPRYRCLECGKVSWIDETLLS